MKGLLTTSEFGSGAIRLGGEPAEVPGRFVRSTGEKNALSAMRSGSSRKSERAAEAAVPETRINHPSMGAFTDSSSTFRPPGSSVTRERREPSQVSLLPLALAFERTAPASRCMWGVGQPSLPELHESIASQFGVVLTRPQRHLKVARLGAPSPMCNLRRHSEHIHLSMLDGSGGIRRNRVS